MDGVKGFLTSKTIWGAIIAMVASIAKAAGYDIGGVDGWVNEIVAVLGAGFAIYGRVVATKKIGK